MANTRLRGILNTAFDPDPDIVSQVTGTGNGSPGFNGLTTVGSGFTPTYAASIDISQILQKSRFVLIVTNSTIGNATITAAFVPPAGAKMRMQINNDAGGARTITLSTGFRFSAATIVGTASKISTIEFVSDGTTWNEVARSVGMT
jgi:hypothetical protein